MKINNKDDPLFSITSRDLEWSYTKGTGAGGQKSKNFPEYKILSRCVG